MNSPAEDISTILVLSSSVTGLTEGTDLFISREPSKPDVVVSIFDTGGGEPQSTAERYEFPTVQVRSRGTAITGYADAYAKLELIKLALHKFANQTIGGTKYIGIWASSDIIPLGYDDNNRPMFSLNFRIHRTA